MKWIIFTLLILLPGSALAQDAGAIETLTGLLNPDLLKYAVAAFSILGALVTIGTVVSTFTANTRDDDLVSKARYWLDRLSLLKDKVAARPK